MRRQIDYGAALGMPWGISESAYNARDLELTYQYSNFGVPGLGFKRGLSENVVIAPYATALAAMVDPRRGDANFARWRRSAGAAATASTRRSTSRRRACRRARRRAIVRAFMAHHQGMTIVAIANALLDGVMRSALPRRADHPGDRAAAAGAHAARRRGGPSARRGSQRRRHGAATRTADRAPPAQSRTPPARRSHLLSNGRYAVMLTAAGSGYSRWGDRAVTRWREDATRDDWGCYIYLRDVESGEVWSAAYQPTAPSPTATTSRSPRIAPSSSGATATLTTTLEVVVSPEDDAEVRRVSIANTGARAREIEVTSYAEIVLAPPAADIAHPAFSKLFVRDRISRRRAAPSWRRAAGAPRTSRRSGRRISRSSRARASASSSSKPTAPASSAAATTSERRRRDRRPAPVQHRGRCSIRSSRCAGGCASRPAARCASPSGRWSRPRARRCSTSSTSITTPTPSSGRDAWPGPRPRCSCTTSASRQSEASLFQRLAGHVALCQSGVAAVVRHDPPRPGAAVGLWPQGISGDLPIVLVRIDDVEDVDIVRELLQAHEYWRMKRLAVDLVILNERGASYVQDLQIALETHGAHQPVAHASRRRERAARAASSCCAADLISAETRALLLRSRASCCSAGAGSLAEQLDRIAEAARRAAALPRKPPTVRLRPKPHAAAAAAATLISSTGSAALQDGREYVTVLGPGQSTPAPWINVIANPRSASRLRPRAAATPGRQQPREPADAVVERSGQRSPGRDALPARRGHRRALEPDGAADPRRAAPYVRGTARATAASSIIAHGIALELLQYVPLDDPIKISRLKLRNISGRPRRLSVTAYVEWVLGPSRGASAPFIVTEIDAATGAMFARNPWNIAFGSARRLCRSRRPADRLDRRPPRVLGRNGCSTNPAALSGDSRCRSGRRRPRSVRRAADHVELARDGTTEIVFLLGEAGGADEARALIAALSRRRSRRRACARSRHSGTTCSARCR